MEERYTLRSEQNADGKAGHPINLFHGGLGTGILQLIEQGIVVVTGDIINALCRRVGPRLPGRIDVIVENLRMFNGTDNGEFDLLLPERQSAEEPDAVPVERRSFQ